MSSQFFGLQISQNTDILHRFLGWSMCYGWDNQLIRMLVIEKLKNEKAPPEAFDEIDIDYPSTVPTMVPNGLSEANVDWEMFSKSTDSTFLKQNLGSNCFAISGKFTESGNPILCSDPHLEPALPGSWYQNHLKVTSSKASSSKGEKGSVLERNLDVIGVSMPGLPMILIGHNHHIAHGITLSFASTSDLFLEKIKQENDKFLYELDGEWKPMETIDEKIVIRGGKVHVEKVLFTHRGPILKNILKHESTILHEGLHGDSNQLQLSHQSTVMRPGTAFQHFVRMNFCENSQEFTTQLKAIDTPSLNITFADVEGNIGYVLTGRGKNIMSTFFLLFTQVPIRPQGSKHGTLIQHGHVTSHDWKRESKSTEMPHAINPKQGFIISCNHKIVDYDRFPIDLGLFLTCQILTDQTRQRISKWKSSSKNARND
jgi:penicillin amidase